MDGLFNIVAAHSDSPCLRVKPHSRILSRDRDFMQVAVETYGGGIWHSWFDRDLAVAGRIVTSTPSMDEKGNACETIAEHLVRIDRSILRIPTLAIHLDSSVREGFKFNNESHLTPILATLKTHQECTPGKDSERAQLPSYVASMLPSGESGNGSMHDVLLRELLLTAPGAAGNSTVIASDLSLYDMQRPSLGGIHGEFVQSARLDNLFMSFSAIQSLVDSLSQEERQEGSSSCSKEDSTVRMAILFDHEEVGSGSASGACSTLVSTAIERVLLEMGASDSLRATLARSFLISADMAHAVHPNYPEKHDDSHRPSMQGGIVLKYNSNQRYTTNSRSAAYIKAIARSIGIPIQEFMVRNDSPCGSTIGPIVSAQLGMQSVDVGAPQLSMHSIREVAGVADLASSIALFTAFFSAASKSIGETYTSRSLDAGYSLSIHAKDPHMST